MIDFPATVSIMNNQIDNQIKEIQVPIYESNHWHVLPLGAKGEFFDIALSVNKLFYIEIEITGD